ncbi:hypothetical protein VOLCADRAFT_102619 [Volvox carteri f. nagariensis]|uniref:TsaA-like domain-containing protein n=1 Tax=Volvox carteri f. nagariensis TaxID=3068 RepID=D8TH36_VOLCA|nr:uncharacterized protein VOLCADRAFT_102619 [Volvox carteri f. nagariensis]EFJ52642.1 hypothetical protein VOLCADRAFT_102619 [Volvox carteri f. nagariensis]|eukprot:XP_002945647.1 hypothetical protein VOLCADRAFT_102619 [Volvox carteri f. nagariensis]
MAWNRQSVLERCAVGAAAAYGLYLLARYVNHRLQAKELQLQLQETQASLEHERVKRKADRVGRIRAEQELRALKVQLQRLELQQQLQPQQPEVATATATTTQQQQQQADDVAQNGAVGEGAEERARVLAEAAGGIKQLGKTETAVGTVEMTVVGKAHVGKAAPDVDRSEDAKRAAAAAAAALAAAGSSMPAFPFRPIGHLQSVFSERNGTPRQPQLVPLARSRLVLAPNIPVACLEGLEQYSHCWVLYVFHANTDLAKYLSSNRAGLKAKIHVPRLNGGRMGVLATRSPHRPSPVGLSTAEVIRVERNTLVLGGTDIVDGSPVLDIKPYVPFCDCLPTARAPSWVQAEADDEPLKVAEVVVGEAARAALTRAWQSRKAHSMYGSAEQYLELVRQVLGRDIRSVHQRLNVRPTRNAVAAAAAAAATAAITTPKPGKATATAAVAPSTSSAPQQQQQEEQPSRVGQGEGAGSGEYHVVLENIYISYDISLSGVVHVYDAWVDPITAARTN